MQGSNSERSSETTSDQTSPFECRHDDLKLEQKNSDYLTGWYICVKCGERFKAM